MATIGIAIAPNDMTSSFHCSKCGMDFLTHNELTEHKSTHMTMRQTTSFKGVVYECDICNKSYILKSSLTRHKKKHLLELMHRSRDQESQIRNKENETPHRDLVAEIQQRRTIIGKNPVEKMMDQPRKQMISLLRPLSDGDSRMNLSLSSDAPGTRLNVICGKDVQMGDYEMSSMKPYNLSVKSGSAGKLGIPTDDLTQHGGSSLKSERYNGADEYECALDLSMKNSSFNYDTSFESSFVKSECENSSYIDLPSDTPLDLSLDSAMLHRRDTYPCDMNTSLPESEIHRLASESYDQYKCKVCPAIFSDRYEMLQHSKIHQKNENAELTSVASDAEQNTCMFCGEVFHNRSKFSKHIRSHYKEQTHYCQFCCIMFLDKSSFQEHCKTHQIQATYKCNVCRTDFQDKKEHVQHLKIHQGNIDAKPYLCGVCFKDFPVKSYLDSHMRVHIENRPFKCPECGKGFSHNFNLTKHLRIHSGEKPYECHICNVTFGQKNSLNRHMITHLSNHKNYQCQICFKVFYKRSLFVEHLIQGHDKNELEGKAKECQTLMLMSAGLPPYDGEQTDTTKMSEMLEQSKCSPVKESLKLKIEVGSEPQDLTKTEKVVYRENTDEYESNVRKEESYCNGKHYSPEVTKFDEHSMESMANNINVRREIFPKSVFPKVEEEIKHDCSEVENEACNDMSEMVNEGDENCVEKELRQKINSIMIQGNAIEGFICPECGKVFKTKNYVRSHLRTHMDLKPYVCKFCNKSFSHSFNLTKHIRCHTGEQPYSCDVCDRRFSHVNSLNRHILLHRLEATKIDEEGDLGASAFECPICRQAFENIMLLENHMTMAHETSESNVSESSTDTLN